MPYQIGKEGKHFVVRSPRGSVLGKHPTHEHAIKQVQAIYAAEDDAKKKKKQAAPDSEEGEAVDEK